MTDLDALATEEMDRDAAFLIFQAPDTTPVTGNEAWVTLAALAATELSSALGFPGAGTDLIHWSGAPAPPAAPEPIIPDRTLRLPGNIVLRLRFGNRVSVNEQGLRNGWSTLRPWRIRRGIQILRAATRWAEAEQIRRAAKAADTYLRAMSGT